MRMRSAFRRALGFSMLEAITWVAISSGVLLVSVSGVPHMQLKQERLQAERDARKMRLAAHLSADYWYLAEELSGLPLSAVERWPASLATLTSGSQNTVAFGNEIGNFNLASLHAGGSIQLDPRNDYRSDQYFTNAGFDANSKSYLELKAVYPQNDDAICSHANHVRGSLHRMGALHAESTNTAPFRDWGTTVTVTCGPANTVVTMLVMDPNMITHNGFNRFGNVATRHNWQASGDINLSGYPLQGLNTQNPSLGGLSLVNNLSLSQQVERALSSNRLATVYVNQLNLSYINVAYNNFTKITNFNSFTEMNFCSDANRHSDLVVEQNVVNHFCNSGGFNLNTAYVIGSRKAIVTSSRPLVFGSPSLLACPENVVANGEQVAFGGGFYQYINLDESGLASENCVGAPFDPFAISISPGVDAASFNGNWGTIDGTSGSFGNLQNFNGYTGTQIYIDTVETNTVIFNKSLSMLENSWEGDASWSVYSYANNSWSAPTGGSPTAWQAPPYSLNGIDSAHAASGTHTHHSHATAARYQRFNALFAGPFFYENEHEVASRACDFVKDDTLAYQHTPNLNTAQALAQLQSANIYHYRYVASGRSHVGWIAEEAAQAMPGSASSVNHGSGDLGFVEERAGAEIAWKALHELRDKKDALKARVREHAEEFRQLEKELAVLKGTAR